MLEQIGTGLLIFSIGWLILSILMMIWAYKRKGLVGFLLAFFLNWVGWIIVACMPKDDKDKDKRERERELIRFHLNRVYVFIINGLKKRQRGLFSEKYRWRWFRPNYKNDKRKIPAKPYC